MRVGLRLLRVDLRLRLSVLLRRWRVQVWVGLRRLRRRRTTVPAIHSRAAVPWPWRKKGVLQLLVRRRKIRNVLGHRSAPFFDCEDS